MSYKKLSNRKDWFFPQRVITRKEEQLQDQAIKEFLFYGLLSPLLLVNWIFSKIFPSKVSSIVTSILFNIIQGVITIVGIGLISLVFYLLFLLLSW